MLAPTNHTTDIGPAPNALAAATTGAVTPPAVELLGVTRRFDEVIALDSVDLTVEAGTTVALLGPNGAGKTTLIGIMLGLDEPTAGAARTLGLLPAAAVAGGRVGAMLQTTGLPAGVKVAELLTFVRQLYPHPLSETDLLERSGLTALAGRRVEALSGGESQRLRFALAIAGDPDLVFLDEPTVAMDVDSRRAFWGDMRRSAAEGRTILFATHYLDEADEVADRIVVLDRGRVVADGTSESIKTSVGGTTVSFLHDGTDPGAFARLAGVTAVQVDRGRTSLTTTDGDATARALVRAGIPFRGLEVSGPDLEDAFVTLTHHDVA
jgi:ABC-2 type transport system ATP-binding protein